MVRKNWFVVLVLVIGCCAGRASAKEIHINNVTGNDINLGQQPNYTGEGGPVRTLWKALRLADSGDQVILANSGQPYRECITLISSHHSGLLANRFTIIGNGAVLDGSKPIPPHCWEHVSGDVFRFHPQRSSFQQLFIDDRPVTRVQAEAGHSPFASCKLANGRCSRATSISVSSRTSPSISISSRAAAIPWGSRCTASIR